MKKIETIIIDDIEDIDLKNPKGKKALKQLIKEEYIANDQLTFKGIALAKEVEQEFKI